MIINVTTDNFKTVVLDSQLAIVDFWAPWCRPCLAFAPLFESFSKEVNITCAKVNTDEFQELAAIYKISAIPTLLVFKNGKLVDSLVGMQSNDALHALVKKYQ